MPSFDEWLIRELQTRGFYTGAQDGAAGRKLYEALQAFQQSKGLKSSGLADAATVRALQGRPDASLHPGAVSPEPVWIREARRFMGLKEIAGSASNSTILGWAKKLGGWIANAYTNDDIPWCGLFVANVIATTLPNEGLPANPLSALAWGKFGRWCNPGLGAILVFTRKGGGHVGFYVGEDDQVFYVLGGNQSNSVSITKIDKSRLYASRWPATGGDAGTRVRMSAAGVVSKDEA